MEIPRAAAAAPGSRFGAAREGLGDVGAPSTPHAGPGAAHEMSEPGRERLSHHPTIGIPMATPLPPETSRGCSRGQGWASRESAELEKPPGPPPALPGTPNPGPRGHIPAGFKSLQEWGFHPCPAQGSWASALQPFP